ncbi:histidine kinase [Ferruginibacter paludis]|jgi:two-component system LytT family sensor kinase|uniref:sensor histidine kinase n=1 Tax=Ferruginibacter TaxID=1004303 RepID=UPI0025B5CD42|nr:MULTISPECIES: histidine kinase [Ferruginibacter]MDB5276003.1 sensor histidine kinase [Ferruginibacter sp.]MDN3658982.1 histidine kinase [Ferruginibacter paludis]
MLKKISKYWVCQLAGWGASMAISTFFYLTLSVRKVDNFVLLILISVLLGILITHLMRMVIREYKVLEKPIQTQIIAFITLTIVFSVVYACADVAIENIFNLRDTGGPKISLANEVARTVINNFFILLIWNLIYYTYHYVERNRRQEVDTLKLQSVVKELELKTIKSHINPHFIFNALNSIRALVDENPTRARTAITELSNILRSSMQAEKLETVPLERELNIVKDYLALEKMRFEERLIVEMDIDEDTLGQPVPPMMLQTLVENAIKHGISKRINGGTIRVISDFVNDHHELVVQNSGQLNGYVNDDGFGVKSTQYRLNLLYQGKATFEIKNTESDMVESRITMPVSFVNVNQ